MNLSETLDIPSFPPGGRRSRLLTLGRAAIYLTALTPLIVVPHFLFPFVTTRNVVFRISCEIALAMVLLVGVRRLRKSGGEDDSILTWLFAYLVAISLAAVFGLSPWHSLFGDFERMGGVWAWLHLVLFYVLLRILMRPADWARLFRATLLVADLVVVWGAFEFLPASLLNPRFGTTLSAGSTLGNPGLLGPYLMLAFALSCGLLFREHRRIWKGFAAVSALILLVGIAGARNRSSELGLLAGVIVGASVLFLLQTDRRRIAKRYVLVLAAGTVIAGVGAYALSLEAPRIAEQFGGRWKGFFASPVDHARTTEWKIAAGGFRDRPLLGYGPENHQIVMSHHFDPQMYTVLGDVIFDRAHNAWLELLETTGIIGTLAMVGIWIAAVVTVRDGIRNRTINAGEAAVVCGGFAAYAVYLTFWFFDINSVMLWVVFLAFLSSRVRRPLDVLGAASEAPAFGWRSRMSTWGAAALIALTAYLHGVIPLIAAYDLGEAASPGLYEDRLAAFGRVMNSSAPQTLHTIPIYYNFLRTSASYMRAPDTNPFLKKEYDLAIQRGLIEADRDISRSPQDDRSYVESARFLMLAGAYHRDPRYVILARDALRRATHISPRRPDIRVLLSNVYLTLRDTSKAVAQLDSAILLAPQYGGAYFYSARLLLGKSNVDSAASLLLAAASRRFVGDERIYYGVISMISRQSQPARAAKLSQVFLDAAYGPQVFWKNGLTVRGVPLTPIAENLAARLPLWYLASGESRNAIKSAVAFAAMAPRATAIANEFVSDIRAGRSYKWQGTTTLLPPPKR